MEKFERLRVYRESLKLSQKDFFERYKIEQRNASKYETGLSTIPDELELKLAADGLNLDWLATGRGEMLLEISPKTAFEIPILTREEALRYEPAREIPEPKANSGEYPSMSLVPIPYRVMEYSTDLRAIVVFDSRMAPVMRSGDVAIIEATGWNGDGIYLYRMGDGLHISYVIEKTPDSPDEPSLQLSFETDKKIVYDAQTFKPIGRVRAVVKDLFGYDKKGE